jgi:hypothetical protein
MAKMVTKVRDKITGKFWNGDVRWSKFNDSGKTWRNLECAERAVLQMMRYADQYKREDLAKLPKKWEFVECEIQEVEKKVVPIDDTFRHAFLKQMVNDEGQYMFGAFYDVMRKKNVIDQIEYIIELEPTEGQRWVDSERIIQARAELRQLGVKTRTFREYNGLFGMMDRQQAMKARLVLNTKKVVDLGTIREEYTKLNA